MSEEEILRLGSLLHGAGRILVFTGAGISTGSGIPDFRGPDGVWSRRKPVYYDDFMTSEAARKEHWDYKLESWKAFRDAQPNAVHFACSELGRRGKLLKLVTQNIDGLHQKAGLKRESLVELHGTNAEVECQTCSARSDSADHFPKYSETREPPRCRCGGFLKQATISFGQSLRQVDLEAAEKAAIQCDLVVALGSTLSVYPAAAIPLIAAQRKVPYAIVNRGPTEHDGHPQVTLRMEGDVVDIFPTAVTRAASLRSG